MRDFFKPSTIKVQVTLVLILYLVVSTVLLASYNSARSKGPRELSTLDKAGLVVAYPAVFLGLPFLYVSQNLFISESPLSQIMEEEGCTNCNEEIFNTPLQHPTPIGFVAGLIVEVLFLYSIGCLSYFLKTRRGYS